MSQVVDITGSRFGKLVVLSRTTSRFNKASWVCRCDCGNDVVCAGGDLRQGKTNSCGCLRTKTALTGDVVGRVFHSYTKDAVKRGFDFLLTRDEFEKLIAGDCYYCGTPPSQTVRIGKRLDRWHPTFRYNGVDRTDNAKGYETSNVVSCCGKCNRAKGTLCVEEFIEMAEAISKRHFKKGTGRLHDNDFR